MNRVGGEDEIIFDGHSFVVNKQEIIHQALAFKQDLIQSNIYPALSQKSEVSFEEQALSLSKDHLPTLRIKNNLLTPLSDNEAKDILSALELGIQDYMRKSGLNNFLVALSGGLDSALVLTLLKLFSKEDQEIEAIYMPSKFSSSLSYEICLDLCQNLNIQLTNFPIKFLHSAIKNEFDNTFDKVESITDENMQSRLRAMLIYARSNQTSSLVINTSNKSELAIGYSTLYGDSTGGIGLLGDLYKSEVYDLSKYINKNFNNIIPQSVITRPPSAELREEQKDTDSLPPYHVLDTILEGHLSYQYNKKEIISLNIKESDVTRVLDLLNSSEYKRYQFCPILKVKSRSFGFGRRIPISKFN